MTYALRRRMQELADAVPSPSRRDRDQMWRHIATELTYRQHETARRQPNRFRFLPLFLAFGLAIAFVGLLPMTYHPNAPGGGYLWRSQLLQAAARKESGPVGGWQATTTTYADGYQRVAANPDYELLIHESGLQFLLHHKSTGQKWGTSPDIRDTRVSEHLLGRLHSPFAIRYGDQDGRIEDWANPFEDLTQLEYLPLSGGVGLRYVFDHIGIAVRLDYELGDGYVQVSIPEDGIEQYGAYRVKSIELLPFFDALEGSGGQNRLIIADRHWDDTVGGTVPRTSAAHATHQGLLFGVAGDKAGFLAEVIDGTDVASVHVDPSGLVVFGERVFIEFALATGDRSASPSQRHTVRYHALTGETLGTDRLADIFRRHMKEQLGTRRQMIEANKLTTDYIG